MAAKYIVYLFFVALCRTALAVSCEEPTVEASFGRSKDEHASRRIFSTSFTMNCDNVISEDHLLNNHGLSTEFGESATGDGVSVMAATSTHSQTVVSIDIVRNDFEGPDADGSYKWAVQTEDGIYHEQRGSLETGPDGKASLVVEGQYQYTAPDGQVINLLYRADENGFQPRGAHLPTPPPTPPAIQRSLDYLATRQPRTDH